MKCEIEGCENPVIEFSSNGRPLCRGHKYGLIAPLPEPLAEPVAPGALPEKQVDGPPEDKSVKKKATK